jgi:hypothetical protein
MEPTGIEPVTDSAEPQKCQRVTSTAENPLAHSLAREVEKDSDLALLVERWGDLPKALRTGIMAMVKAAQGH